MKLPKIVRKIRVRSLRIYFFLSCLPQFVTRMYSDVFYTGAFQNMRSFHRKSVELILELTNIVPKRYMYV